MTKSNLLPLSIFFTNLIIFFITPSYAQLSCTGNSRAICLANNPSPITTSDQYKCNWNRNRNPKCKMVANPTYIPPSTTNSSSSNLSQVEGNSFETTLCNLLRLVTGTGGKAFVAFAIISVGIGFFTGKVSWGLMIGVAAGIAVVFGAPTIVSAIAGSSKIDANGCAGILVD